jgi:hypothetical protein
MPEAGILGLLQALFLRTINMKRFQSLYGAKSRLLYNLFVAVYESCIKVIYELLLWC